jgi:predicted Zn-dependent protease
MIGFDLEAEQDPGFIHRIRAAEGWLELGLPAEAHAEIDALSPSQRKHPLSLNCRWRIYSESGEWAKAADTASELVVAAPENESGWIHRSYALHELRRTREAAALLRPAVEKFPNEEVIPYNLACYASQLGQLKEAREWLDLAFKRGDRKEIKKRALADPDLLPLRDYIAQLLW